MGEIISVVDPTLKHCNKDEVELVLSLGILCSHPRPEYRPSMRKVVQRLGDVNLHALPTDIHLDLSMKMMEYSDSLPDDSSISYGRTGSSKSNSFTNLEKISVSKGTKIIS